ncbi:MAG: hypothetical protein U5J82_08405 [Desulfobacterales bacterium]|nr:hypothetical protein [Desulfobacterales bacterium]
MKQAPSRANIPQTEEHGEEKKRREGAKGDWGTSWMPWRCAEKKKEQCQRPQGRKGGWKFEKTSLKGKKGGPGMAGDRGRNIDEDMRMTATYGEWCRWSQPPKHPFGPWRLAERFRLI